MFIIKNSFSMNAFLTFYLFLVFFFLELKKFKTIELKKYKRENYLIVDIYSLLITKNYLFVFILIKEYVKILKTWKKTL